MSVHYKFKSNLDHDTVTFDGLSISVADLKKSIMQQKKIGKSSDFDLQITNAQTKEVYDNDEMLVPKNTSVIVARVPVATGNKKNWDKPDLPLPIDDDDLGQIRYDRIVKSADLVNANTTEEDKVKAMITQSSQEYDPSKYVKSRSMTGPLPPTYTCYRCGKQGHWIKNCPTNNPDVKRSTGIPRSFMVPVDGPEHKGALLTSSGDYAVPLIDHQAYKEVKKEKPPFVPQDEPPAEPEAQIPEELLCMVCKDLLQDAVLIPCCGNSFCDECVRQVLLESDNHECPVCHETEVSPNTLIPNRFLRTAVLNFKNETGYTRIKKITVKSPQIDPQPVESPQPSPDSTVENQPQQIDSVSVTEDAESKVDANVDVKKESDACTTVASDGVEGETCSDVIHTPEDANSPKPGIDDESDDIQPGTPLADEPPVDIVSQPLPIQTIGQDNYNGERYDYGTNSKCNRTHQKEYHRYRDDSTPCLEPNPISTIETITNARKTKFLGRPAPVRQQFNQRPHRDERPENYSHEREDYRSRYERRHHSDRSQRTSHHSRYDRSPRDARYHQESNHEYSLSEQEQQESLYDPHLHREESICRHQERYRTSPHPIHVTQPVPPTVYAVPSVPLPQPLLPTPHVYAPQPPPPGASPVDTSHIAAQPPPPGVGPLLPPSISSDPAAAFSTHPYDMEDPLKDVKKVDERSINDRLEAFQRELEKRDRDYSRDRASRSRSRSSDRERSRSSSRSRSYSSSKSWTRSPSRSSTRTSRSRSRTPFSSRSRSRSYTHSRSRSWSKARSYTRSRSRTRTESSRSRSRSRTESRLRRRGGSRERVRSPKQRTRSRSFSPKDYRPSARRNVTYTGKHSYTPPQYGPSYQSQYGPPPPVLPIPVMRAPTFPAHHLHTLHPSVQPIHSRPVEHYPIERSSKYPQSYNEPYPVYDMYQPKYQQRFDREQRIMRYDKRQDYQRQQDEVAHRIPGWVGDRSREYKPRYRQPRDQQRKEIKELPKVPETELRVVHTKDLVEEVSVKKKDDKVLPKHKKHHHHHKNKEVKKLEKQDHKIPVVIGVEKYPETSRNLINVEVSEKINESKLTLETTKTAKNQDKTKDKKHKHKKHKGNEQISKKKKSGKKGKLEGTVAIDSDIPVKVKTKKKKNKVKTVVENKEYVDEEEKVASPTPAAQVKSDTENTANDEVLTEDASAKNVQETSADTLDLFADEAQNETVLLNEEVPDIDSRENENLLSESVNETENIEESLNSEEELEESVEDENVLRVDVPALSKWEREELEEDYVSKPQRRSAVVVPKDDKASLSSDIIQRAELVILSNPFKPRIGAKEKSDSKDSSGGSSPEVPVNKHKETPDLKSVVTSERLASPNLQVTISTTKEKRSVHSKKDERPSKDLDHPQVSKRIKLDHPSSSQRGHEDQSLHRKITIHNAKPGDKLKESRDKTSDRHERRRSPPREIVGNKRNSSRDHRDYCRKGDRESRRDDEHIYVRDERKHKFVDHERYYRSSNDYSNSRESRPDRRRYVNEYVSQSRSRRPGERSLSHQSDKLRKTSSYRRSHSRSYDSSGSSHKGRQNERRTIQHEERHREKSNRDREPTDINESSQRRKHSPVKPPEKRSTVSDHSKTERKDFHDDLKFEPDYDEYSDIEEKTLEKYKRKSVSPESTKKRVKLDKTITTSESDVKDTHRTDKSSITSSDSSSEVSESDSSDSDDQKGSKSKSSDTDYKQKHKKSRHKKHKKHKHKHKKKKSHKSKQRD